MGEVHFKLSLCNLSVIARQLVVEAIQCKRCILDCFVPRNDGMRQFEMHPMGEAGWHPIDCHERRPCE